MTGRPVLTERQVRIRAEWQEARDRMPGLRRGVSIRIKTAGGDWLFRVADSGVEAGHSMAVVWFRDEGARIPWPANAVELG